MKTIAPYTPIQYIMGKQEFFGLDFMVNENVFIPRPETEKLVDEVVSLVQSTGCMVQSPRILDLCTGSGNIAISLMVRLRSPSILSEVEGLTKNMPDCKIVASDISQDTLDVAKRNAARHGVNDIIEFVRSDLFENVEGKFDIIVSNPPYIARYEFRDIGREVLMEPMAALYGGEDGLDFYRRIIKDAESHLRGGGYLIMEIGFGQAAEIRKIIDRTESLKVLKIRKDRNGIGRVIM